METEADVVGIDEEEDEVGPEVRELEAEGGSGSWAYRLE